MRRIHSFFPAVLLVAACGGGPGKSPVTATMAETSAGPAREGGTLERQRRTVSALVDAINAGDARKVSAAYAEGASVTVIGAPEVKGRDAIARGWQEWFDGFPGMKLALTRVFAKGEVVAAEWAWNGTHGGDFMGDRATNKPAGALGVSVLWIGADGSIRTEHRYTDLPTVRAQLGLTKRKNPRPIPTLPTSAEWIASTGAPAEEANIPPMKAIYDAATSKSEADYMAALAEDVVYDDLTRPEPIVGREGARKDLAVFAAGFPDAKFRIVNAWGIGRWAVVEQTMTGTQTGQLGPLPPTGKPAVLHVVDIGFIEGGKYKKGITYGNGYELLEQLGVSTAKGTTAAPK